MLHDVTNCLRDLVAALEGEREAMADHLAGRQTGLIRARERLNANLRVSHSVLQLMNTCTNCGHDLGSHDLEKGCLFELPQDGVCDCNCFEEREK